VKNILISVASVLFVIGLMLDASSITKKECCDKCKTIEEKCLDEMLDRYALNTTNGQLDKECENKIRDCKADCGEECDLLK
jgi:hypothetical protein